MGTLLAVDLGLRCGLAVFGAEGRLRTYRSTNFGSRERLRRGVGGVLAELEELDVVYVEGDTGLGEVWEREATRRGARVVAISAEVWRAELLLARTRRTGVDAKEAADTLARRVIAWSGARRPTSLRHDAAEAILIGLYGVLQEGWLSAVPEEVGR